MTAEELGKELERFRRGEKSADEIAADLRAAPFEDFGFAKIDRHRELRQGVSEVVYGAGKTADEILAVVSRLRRASSRPVLVTRVSPEKAAPLVAAFPETRYDALSRLAVVGAPPPPDGAGE
ncbi:MAG: 1-(5-phosphoribosyl)-5-amino-4-imidazole-carboxylate carboxylase, partial [Kiritimatiellae bacterium]|nr:1-(5-phosphoribosyl)-5-amino-4-imidazole-carboxylate carboxylase [Kiritimatiellia bacterium]